MEVSEEKFKQISHGTLNNITVTSYRGTKPKDIEGEENFKDLGAIMYEKL